MANNIELKNINKSYEGFSLKDVSINVPKGSIVGFIGENGAGKTTTIKSMLNLINIDSGTVKIFDKDIKENECEIKENLGVVLDNSFLFESYNVLDINRIMKHIYVNWNEKEYFDYLDKFKLPKDKVIKDFSTGMLMKLKIATALSHHPEVLILDEPTSGLDPIARAEILEIFEDFVEDKNHSIFVSSHITSDLEHVADYIVFISNGKILLSEKKDKILDEYGIITCDEKDFNKYDKKDFVRYKKTRNTYELLIDNKKEFKKKYKLKDIDKATLDDIMLLYIKGEN